MADRREIDAVTDTETTGHEWDGIKELDTPMPRWWLWTFYATIVWGIAYTILMPAWPLVTGATPGLLGYSSRAEVDAHIAAVRAANAPLDARLLAWAAGIGYAYVTNQSGTRLTGDPRDVALREALYAAIRKPQPDVPIRRDRTAA